MGPPKGCRSSRADDDAVAARVAGDVVLLVAAGARALVVAEAAAGAAAVDLDAVALARDAVALAGAAAAVRGGRAVAGERRARRRAVRAVGQAGAGRGDGRAGEVVDVLGILESGAVEASGELVNGLVGEVGIQDVAGGVRGHGLGRDDLGDGQGATLGDVNGQRGALGGSLFP